MASKKKSENWEKVKNGVVHKSNRYFIPKERLGDDDWLQSLCKDKKWLSEDDLEDLKKFAPKRKAPDQEDSDEGEDSKGTEESDESDDGELPKGDSEETEVATEKDKPESEGKPDVSGKVG